MTNKIDYTQEDTLDLAFFAPDNPVTGERGLAGILPLLAAIETHAQALRPDRILSGRKNIPYSPDAVERELKRQSKESKMRFSLIHNNNPEVVYEMSLLQPPSEITNFWMEMITPLDWCIEKEQAEVRAKLFIALVRALSAVCRPAYGYCHPKGDLFMGTDPHLSSALAPADVYEMYWLNIYGTELVERLGRDRVLSTPAEKIEELPGGGILILTRPSPADYASEEARVVQARALAHLRDDISFEQALTRLRARSATLAPVQKNWDSDITELLEMILNESGFSRRQERIAELNNYHSPGVAEWRPLAQLLPVDVDDPAAIINRYENILAEQAIALLHKYIPEIVRSSSDVLSKIDYHFWQFDYPGTFKRTDIENDLVPAIGAFLGLLLVRHLGGHWIPRRSIDESQVVVGDRAWFPFLRARHFLHDKQSTLDYSLTKYFREAERSSGRQSCEAKKSGN